jgi:hypothetical protein
VSVLPGEITDPVGYAEAIAAGAIEERYPVDFAEEVRGALARYRKTGPGLVSWSVARHRLKGDHPEVPDRVARGNCATIEAARVAVGLILPWVMGSDGEG